MNSEILLIAVMILLYCKDYKSLGLFKS